MEKVIQFGGAGNLTGIVCTPSGERRPGPGVILLNSGILHRVGACRLHVQMARELADVGVTSLRFDFSGIGDSEPRKDSLPFEQSAQLEVVDAMNYLARAHSLESFHLAGLCSGADAAFNTAVIDTRVVGLCQLDPWPYRTWKHYLHYYAPKLKSGAAWKRYVARRLGVSPTNAPQVPGEDLELPTYVRVNPPRDEVAGHLRNLIARGVRLLHIYSGGQPEYNYRAQFTDAFRSVNFRNQLQLEYLPTASHIFTGFDDQRRVLSLVTDWVLERARRSGAIDPAAPGAAA